MPRTAPSREKFLFRAWPVAEVNKQYRVFKKLPSCESTLFTLARLEPVSLLIDLKVLILLESGFIHSQIGFDSSRFRPSTSLRFAK